MNTVIKVEGLSKQYRLGQVGRKTLHADFNRWLYRVIGKEDPYLKIGEENDRSVKGSSDYVWALKNINFAVQQGEVLGIIGRNGAGKSTLLKILSKVTAPTTGNVKIKGRIASLLEVGTGFHPELSGRDNIFLNGAIMGMSRKEIQQKLAEIVDFAGVERYLDTPVKRYSSGMYVRLAFAVAAHLEPDILIVDEVLAVGDAEFQKKCLGKMKDVSEKDGRTVLFVSHNMEAISRLCQTAIILKNGTVNFFGDSSAAVRIYLEKGANNTAYAKYEKNKPGNNIVRLLEASILDSNNLVSNTISITSSVKVNFKFEVYQSDVELTPGINLHNSDLIHILSSHDVKTAKSKKRFEKGVHESTVLIPANFLAEGLVLVSVAVMSYNPFTIHFHEKEVLSFLIVDVNGEDTARGIYGGRFPGVVRPLLNWSLEKK